MTPGAWGSAHRYRLPSPWRGGSQRGGTTMADVELIALTIEARRRGVSYGQLVARTTEEERRKIVDEYRRGPRRKENKGK